MAEALERYDLRAAVVMLLNFVDDLNNWYIRRSRERFWKSEQDADKMAAYETLHEVLVLLCQVAAPLTPFLTEAIYKNLTGDESVHLTDWPAPDQSRIDEALNQKMAVVRQIASLGLAARSRAGVKVRQPLANVSVKTRQVLDEADLALLRDELNVKQVELLDDVSEYAAAVAKPQGSAIGPRFGRDTAAIIKAAKSGDFETLPDGRVQVAGRSDWLLTPAEIKVHYEAKPGYACETKADLVVVLDLHLDENLLQEGLAREIVRHIQTLRKEADYRLDDRIVAGVFTDSPELTATLDEFGDYIRAEVLAAEVATTANNVWDMRKTVKVDGVSFEVAIRRSAA
jgi:isoleucyl-tRNA synthetase